MEMRMPKASIQVSEVFRFDPDWIFWQQADLALDWLRERMPQRPDLHNTFLKTPSFWAWWLDEWSLVDETMLDYAEWHDNKFLYRIEREKLDITPIQDRVRFYLSRHKDHALQEPLRSEVIETLAFEDKKQYLNIY